MSPADFLQYIQPSSNDQSIQFLYQLFGGMGSLLSEAQQTTGGVGGTTLLTALLSAFNKVALGVGTLIVAYTAVVGLLKTAAEGEFLGRQWNSLWVPLRMVLGIASLVPTTASGYSVLQIVMMWVILQGIGAADFMWRTALAYLQVHGSPYVSSPAGSTVNPTQQFVQLFQMMTCEHAMWQTSSTTYFPKNVPGDKDNTYGYGICNKKSQADCDGMLLSADSVDTAVNQVRNANANNPYTPNQMASVTLQGSCGTLKIPAGGTCPFSGVAWKDVPADKQQTELTCRVENAQIDAVKRSIANFSTISAQFFKEDVAYQQYYTLALAATSQAGANAVSTFLQNNPGMQSACMAAKRTGLISSTMPIAGEKGTNQVDSCYTSAVSAAFGPPAGSATDIGKLVKLVYYPALLNDMPNLKNVNFIAVNVGSYSSAIGQPIQDIMQEQVDNLTENPDQLTGVFAEAEQWGWIYAGAYYYTIAESNNSKTDLTTNVTFQANLGPYADATTKLYKSINDIDAAGALASLVQGQDPSGGTFSVGGATAVAGAQVSQIGTTAASGMLSSWIKTNGTSISGQKVDPVAALQSWGYGVLVAAPIVWIVMIAVLIPLGFVAHLAPSVLGNSIGAPGAGIFWTIFFTLVPLLGALVVFMITIGGLIGVYVPLIPYIIYIIGGLGWLISVVETMVAGPLVALGILAPGGHHDVLGKAEPALMLLFNNFLRPTLMVIGMGASILLAPIAVQILNATFQQMANSIMNLGTNNTAGSNAYMAQAQGNLLEIIIFMCAYVMLTITLLNKCFAAIHVIPEKVMRWIGGQGEAYGEGEAVGEMRRSVEGAASGVAGAGRTVQEKGEAAAAKGGKMAAKIKGEGGTKDQTDQSVNKP